MWVWFSWFGHFITHYDDVIMSLMASQITSLTIVYSASYSGVDQRKHQSSASLAFVRGIHRGPVNSPDKRPVSRKMFPFDDVIIFFVNLVALWLSLKNIQSFKRICSLIISTAWCNTAVSLLLTHWRYCSLALSHRIMTMHICKVSVTGMIIRK